MSSFGFVWGSGVLIDLSTNTNPLLWAGLSVESAEDMAVLMVLSSFIHAVGIRINGRWFLSPFFRVFSMLVYSLVFTYLSSVGAGTTAIWTYGFITALFLLGAINAASDCARIILYRELRWKQ